MVVLCASPDQMFLSTGLPNHYASNKGNVTALETQVVPPGGTAMETQVVPPGGAALETQVIPQSIVPNRHITTPHTKAICAVNAAHLLQVQN